MNRPTYCRSRSDGLHQHGSKDCIRCRPVTKPAQFKTKEKNQ